MKLYFGYSERYTKIKFKSERIQHHGICNIDFNEERQLKKNWKDEAEEAKKEPQQQENIPKIITIIYKAMKQELKRIKLNCACFLCTLNTEHSQNTYSHSQYLGFILFLCVFLFPWLGLNCVIGIGNDWFRRECVTACNVNIFAQWKWAPALWLYKAHQISRMYSLSFTLNTINQFIVLLEQPKRNVRLVLSFSRVMLSCCPFLSCSLSLCIFNPY